MTAREDKLAKPERRKLSRFGVGLQATVSFLFRSHAIERTALVCNLTERGAMVKLDLPQELYHMLLVKPRYCRLQFNATRDLPQQVLGKAVWVQPESSRDSSQFKIGVFFERCSEAAKVQLRMYGEADVCPPG